jgi:hypothetical protein
MRRFVPALACLLAIPAFALAYPPATIENVTQTSVKVAGLDCDTLYRIRVQERNSSNTNWTELETYTPRTATCTLPPPPPPPPPTKCANRLDDDGDGLVDLADPGCVNEQDDDESNVAQPSHPVPVRELSLPVATVPGTPHHMCSVWDTDHTEIFPTEPPAQNVDKHGTLRWEPGGHYATGEKVYMLLGRRVISGTPGRQSVGHNHPGDAPYGWTPLSAPQGEPSGVSNPAIDWFGPSGRGYEMVVEPENAWSGSGGSGDYHWQIFSNAEAEARRGQWIWLWVEWTWGRKDGSNDPPGTVKVWVAGEDTPRINKTNVNTHWFGQGMVTFWECTYWFGGTAHGMSQPSVVEVAGPRFGRTPQEAYNDNPRFHQAWQGESGIGSSTAKPSVEGNVPIPSALR